MKRKPLGRLGVSLCALLAATCVESEPQIEADQLVSGTVHEGDSCPSPDVTVQCHSPGPQQVDGMGEVCAVGERRCVDGHWGPCVDIELLAMESPTVAPGTERSALLGTPELCGGCDPACFLTTDCPSGADVDNPLASFDGVRFDAELGGIVIGQPSKSSGSRYAWISTNGSDVLNKLNMETLTNDGVYRVGGNPSRTTVDSHGNVYVGNRDTGDITKVAGELANCIDRNGTPGIQTSAGETPAGSKVFDLRGDINDLVDPDECIIWQMPVGPGTGQPKALAIDARGRLWVGDTKLGQYFVMDIDTGNILHGPINVDHSPYGCAIAPDGLLWSGAKDDTIQSIDTTVLNPTDADVGILIDSPGSIYGIAVDGMNRVFVADGNDLSRYDPATGTWDTEATDGAKGVSVDGSGHVYVAGDGSDAIIEHDAETLLEIQRWTVERSPKGCAPDFWGRVWGANNGSADVGVVDVATGVVIYINTYGNNYTYSDFTGFGFATFTNPMGHYRRLYDSVDSCGPFVDSWRAQLHVSVDTPDTTSIVFWARGAATEAGLDTAVDVWIGEQPPDVGGMDIANALEAAGQDPVPRFLEIRASLMRNGSTFSPMLRTMALEEYCE